MDQGIGRILDQLKTNGKLENTLVIFLADNGACAENITGRNLNNSDIPIGARGSYAAYREPWANASNTPFRLYKQWQHEGGILTPFIVHWPQGIKAPGRISRSIGHIIDVMPTLIELSAGQHPDAASIPLDGISLSGVMSDAEEWLDRELFFEHIGNRALRQGRWKIAWDRRDQKWELYDLEADPVETRDLSEIFPAHRDSLIAHWEERADRLGVIW